MILQKHAIIISIVYKKLDDCQEQCKLLLFGISVWSMHYE